MKLGFLAVAAALLVAPQAGQAQEYETDALLHAVYALWGMMDGAANFCWEVADYEVSYMEAHQNWLARNFVVRGELDAILATLGEAPGFAADAEAVGSNGILEILRPATNPEEACGNWRSTTDAGGYEAEVFMREQLGLLRERGGM